MRKKIQNIRVQSLLLIGLLLTTLLLSSCDTSSSTSSATINGAGGKNCQKVGILLPDSTTSDRWETKDHPLLVQSITNAIPNVQIDYNNAQGSSAVQLQKAEDFMADGACILIVAPHDSIAAAAIVDQARKQNVPVIAYDRLIQSKYLNYYVSFDNIKVGELQGDYITSHYTQFSSTTPTHMVMISGSQTDTNALLFSQGVHESLDPLLANGTLKNMQETFTPDWNPTTAQAEMETALTQEKNDIQVAYVANDGMASTVIAALKTFHLNGKVLVTGQDASKEAIHDILLGDQSMTVYKPISQEAQSAGNLVKALHDGGDVNGLTHGIAMQTYDGGNIPSILDVPVEVEKDNIEQTVIADGFLQPKDICNGIPHGTAGVC